MVMVIELHNFKILSSLLHGYHIPQLQSIAIPAMAFSPTILPTFHHGIFFNWQSLLILIPLNLFFFLEIWLFTKDNVFSK